MNYHNITKDDMLNGDGLRIVLWTAGCNHGCFNCQNPITWNPNDGIPFDESAMNELIENLQQPYISGLTLSGGDPMFQSNRDTIYEICKTVKSLFPNKTIWMYTGYAFEEIKNEPILKYIDVLVDGEYIDELNDTQTHWVGSINQRVINVKDSLHYNKIILHH